MGHHTVGLRPFLVDRYLYRVKIGVIEMKMQQHDRSSEAGFTLIELVMVIVILGILAAVATPKFTSLVDEAEKSAAKGVAGALASASSTNWAVCKAATSQASMGSCTAVASCDNVVGLLDAAEAVNVRATYTISGTVGSATDPCKLTAKSNSSITATFTAMTATQPSS